MQPGRAEPTESKQEQTHTHTNRHTGAHTLRPASWHSCQSVENIFTHTHRDRSANTETPRKIAANMANKSFHAAAKSGNAFKI